jgi:AbrB family looped-hinge helix DNA binding protein
MRVIAYMPTKHTVTITSMGSSSIIVLPKPVVDGFNLTKGSRLEMIVKDDGIYIPLTERKAETTKDDYSVDEKK